MGGGGGGGGRGRGGGGGDGGGGGAYKVNRVEESEGFVRSTTKVAIRSTIKKY